MNNVGTAYVLWLGCLLQLHGLQRLYNGKIFTGLLWMFTFGLFGIGQMIDLILIPGMVEEHNEKYRAKYGLPYDPAQSQLRFEQVVVKPTPMRPAIAPDPNALAIKLVKAAAARGGTISVTQGVLDTEADFVEVEVALKTMVKTGYVDANNDPQTGVVVYEFRELT